MHQDRIDLRLIRGILDKMIGANYMRLNRLVAELTTISGVSIRHSKAVEEIVFHAIKSTSPQAIPKYFKKLLELLLEVCTANGATNFSENKRTSLNKFSEVSNLKKVVKSFRSLGSEK